MARINHLSSSTTVAGESFSSTTTEAGMDWSFPLLNDSSSFNAEINVFDQAMSSAKSNKSNKDMESALDNIDNAAKAIVNTAVNTYRYVLNFRNQPGGTSNPVLPMSEVSSIKEATAARPRGQGYPPVSCWLNAEDSNGKMIPIAPVNLSNGKDLFMDHIEKAFQAYRQDNGMSVPVETPKTIDDTTFGDNS